MIRRRLIAAEFVYFISLRLACHSIYALSCRCQAATLWGVPLPDDRPLQTKCKRNCAASIQISNFFVVVHSRTNSQHTHLTCTVNPSTTWNELFFFCLSLRRFVILRYSCHQCVRVGRLWLCGYAASTTTSSIAFLYSNFYIFLRDPANVSRAKYTKNRFS